MTTKKMTHEEMFPRTSKTLARAMKLADPTLWHTPSGMELELGWSKDGSVGTLYITRIGNAGESTVKIAMATAELDELREFLSNNIE